MHYWSCIPLFILLSACGQREYNTATIPEGVVAVDGERSEEAWSHSTPITAFTNPWNKEVCPETSLSMVKDSSHLYFYFEVKDDEILLDSTLSSERQIAKEDRVELFFSRDKGMKEYYCFEIDAKGRTLSYAANYYRQLNFAWEVPVGYTVVSRIISGGYAVEGSIPLAFIRGLSSDGELYFGAYRAEFSRVKGITVENWLTYIDPQTATPDFHVPASLGKLNCK